MSDTAEAQDQPDVGFALDSLSESKIALADILLDPNNPRLIGRDGYEGVPEQRVGEEGVQRATLSKLNEGPFDMESIRGSIEGSGLLLIDRIVVRRANDKQYVVVEGNRRIAACKTLLAQHEAGERELREVVLSSVKEPAVLVLPESDPERARLDQWVIQGIRHISGIRPWGAYQAAKTIEAMIKGLGYTENQVVAALSIPKSRVRRSLKVLAGLSQMEEDDDYGAFAGPELYGYFDEVVKRPKVRSWLGWNDSTNRFEDLDRLEMFFSWITPDDELGQNERRLPASSNVRNLDEVVADDLAVSVLNTPGKTIQDALAALAPTREPEWREPVRRASKALDALPVNVLEHLDTDDEKLITSLVAVANSRLNLAQQLSQES